MLNISAVIITFNEERNIDRCLKSLQNVADEIIVLDSFSTDKTEEICRTYKVKFFTHAFDGHVQQKNRVMSMASNDLVLSLDADEALDEELANEIRSIKNRSDVAAYKFNRMTNYVGQWIKHSGWYPDTKVRLWDKTQGKWGGTNPHDKVILNNNIAVKHLKGNILHYSYYSVEEHFKQNNYFTSIAALEMFKNGKKANIFMAIIKSIWIFKRNYLFKLGFLDGYYGFIICKLTAQATFSKYIKLIELNKSKIE